MFYGLQSGFKRQGQKGGHLAHAAMPPRKACATAKSSAVKQREKVLKRPAESRPAAGTSHGLGGPEKNMLIDIQKKQLEKLKVEDPDCDEKIRNA